mmetsp:Transcript_32465/g.52810  ORF Transcript_32465/g.52810 Transcript_32465/m.52810 type:complete len:83 (-) Transcript_32465:105-353(-)
MERLQKMGLQKTATTAKLFGNVSYNRNQDSKPSYYIYSNTQLVTEETHLLQHIFFCTRAHFEIALRNWYLSVYMQHVWRWLH